jgi:hypothetical protein
VNGYVIGVGGFLEVSAGFEEGGVNDGVGHRCRRNVANARDGLKAQTDWHGDML